MSKKGGLLPWLGLQDLQILPCARRRKVTNQEGAGLQSRSVLALVMPCKSPDFSVPTGLDPARTRFEMKQLSHSIRHQVDYS